MKLSCILLSLFSTGLLAAEARQATQPKHPETPDHSCDLIIQRPQDNDIDSSKDQKIEHQDQHELNLEKEARIKIQMQTALETYTNKLNQPDTTTIVRYTSEHCMHCVNLEPIWNEMTPILTKEGVQVLTIHADQEENSLISQHEMIRGYPTIKVFVSYRGQLIEHQYTGPRDKAETLLSYVRGFDVSNVVVAKCHEDLAEIRKANPIVFLFAGFKPSHEYLRLCDLKYRNTPKLVLYEGYPVDRPTLLAFRGDDMTAPSAQYQAPIDGIDFPSLIEFTENNKFPIVQDFADADIMSYVKVKCLLVLGVYNTQEEKEDMVQKLQELYSPKNPTVQFLVLNYSKYSDFCTHFGINSEPKTPTILMNNLETMDKYVVPDISTKKLISDYLETVLIQNAEPYMRSLEPEQLMEKNVRNLSCKSFASYVIDDPRPTFVVFKINKQKQALKLFEDVVEMSEKYASEPIKFAMFDLATNDLPREIINKDFQIRYLSLFMDGGARVEGIEEMPSLYSIGKLIEKYLDIPNKYEHLKEAHQKLLEAGDDFEHGQSEGSGGSSGYYSFDEEPPIEDDENVSTHASTEESRPSHIPDAEVGL